MTIPMRRPRPQGGPLRPRTRRPALRLREVALGFGLVAILVCGITTTARAAVGDASDLPAALVAAVGITGVAVALVRLGRRRPRTYGSPVPTELVGPPAPHGAVDPAGAGDPVDAARPVGAVEPAGAVETVETVEHILVPDYEAMDADAFERAVAELCERDGCVDVEVVGGAGDLGADVLATAPDGRRIVIQCKFYGPGHKVGSQDVQRFGGTCFVVHGAHVAAVVTTSEYTEPALDYAAQCGILCLDREALDAWTEGTGPAVWLMAPDHDDTRC
ncbi:restriction endonuclease [Streptomyces sp. SP18CS02]|uniref:restriction endonuclease n=1 Tax=Streptomyces sp. SP18CS02 TaxID=3002531 RepID=UPI002E79A82D|nr:restriction endonuclease [Streptomyces sp. SP18CS02]MEE1752089.1 restriction endonuclease [Streptomyces sp. SP18CS02]